MATILLINIAKILRIISKIIKGINNKKNCYVSLKLIKAVKFLAKTWTLGQKKIKFLLNHQVSQELKDCRTFLILKKANMLKQIHRSNNQFIIPKIDLYALKSDHIYMFSCCSFILIIFINILLIKTYSNSIKNKLAQFSLINSTKLSIKRGHPSSSL